MMEHSRIDGEQIIDRYLVGALSAEDEARFEEHLFACDECLAKVEGGEHLRRGLRAVAAEDTARALISHSLLGRLRRRPGRLAALAGLALALLLLPAVILWQRAEMERLRTQVRQATLGSAGFSEPLGDLLVVSLGMTRDAANQVEVRPDPARAILLSLELQRVDATSYRVTLYDASEAVLWQGAGLEPNLYDTLAIALPPSFLTPGSYRIVIEGQPQREGEGATAAGEVLLKVLPGG